MMTASQLGWRVTTCVCMTETCKAGPAVDFNLCAVWLVDLLNALP